MASSGWGQVAAGFLAMGYVQGPAPVAESPAFTPLLFSSPTGPQIPAGAALPFHHPAPSSRKVGEDLGI